MIYLERVIHLEKRRDRLVRKSRNVQVVECCSYGGVLKDMTACSTLESAKMVSG